MKKYIPYILAGAVGALPIAIPAIGFLHLVLLIPFGYFCLSEEKRKAKIEYFCGLLLTGKGTRKRILASEVSNELQQKYTRWLEGWSRKGMVQLQRQFQIHSAMQKDQKKRRSQQHGVKGEFFAGQIAHSAFAYCYNVECVRHRRTDRQHDSLPGYMYFGVVIALAQQSNADQTAQRQNNTGNDAPREFFAVHRLTDNDQMYYNYKR